MGIVIVTVTITIPATIIIKVFKIHRPHCQLISQLLYIPYTQH